MNHNRSGLERFAQCVSRRTDKNTLERLTMASNFTDTLHPWERDLIREFAPFGHPSRKGDVEPDTNEDTK